MADRYWVGGTASWDGTVGTKWAATSGGAGGASVPTSADAVFFDAASGVSTVTIAAGNTGAASINCTGFTGTIAGSGAISVAGSVTLVSAMTYTHTGTMTFSGTGTLTTAGKTFSAVVVNGAGITLTLGDALNISSRTLAVTQGTFTTSGFAVTCGSFSSSGALTRVINLGSSTVTISGSAGLVFASTGLTFNGASSPISLTNTSVQVFSGAGFTYGTVTFAAMGSGSRSISGANTFASLTIAPPSSDGVIVTTIGANQTVTGTLNCNVTNRGRRNSLRSDVQATPRTLTVATLTANNCDWRDIALAGAAAPAAPTGAGDCGGNSGITFAAPRLVYRVGTSSFWFSVNSWALTSGGTGDTFPLAQDTAVFDVNSGNSIQFLNSGYSVGTLDASARTTPLTINHDATFNFYGSYILGSGVTVSGTSTQNFFGRGTADFTSAGKTITFGITQNAPGGTLRLTGAVTTSLSAFSYFQLERGTLDLNNFTLTLSGGLANSGFGSNYAGNARTLAFGTGNISISNTTGDICVISGNGLTVTGTPVINITQNTASIGTVNAANTNESNCISFNFTAGTYTVSFLGIVRNLNFTGFAGTLANITRTIFGDLTVSTGMALAAGGNTLTFGSTSGTARTIRTNGKTFDFPLNFDGAGGTFRLLDNFTMGATRALTHTNGTIDLNGAILTVGSTYTTGVGTKNLTFNSGTLTCPAVGNAFSNVNPSGFTTTQGFSFGFIRMTAATSKTFVGGGSDFSACELVNGGAGALTIEGSNTFLALSNAVQPTSFLFTAGTTTTLTDWFINGTAGNLVTINSTTGAQHTLFKSSGTVNADYLSITNSFATGGATWNAGANSVNGGNNVGWFGSAPPSAGGFFMFLC